MEHIEGWMIAALVAFTALIGSLYDNRRRFAEHIKKNADNITKICKLTGEHAKDPVAHAGFSVSEVLCKERMDGLREGLTEVKLAIKAVHSRLDRLNNGK